VTSTFRLSDHLNYSSPHTKVPKLSTAYSLQVRTPADHFPPNSTLSTDFSLLLLAVLSLSTCSYDRIDESSGHYSVTAFSVDYRKVSQTNPIVLDRITEAAQGCLSQLQPLSHICTVTRYYHHVRGHRKFPAKELRCTASRWYYMWIWPIEFIRQHREWCNLQI
jgi:hypothetical protein